MQQFIIIIFILYSIVSVARKSLAILVEKTRITLPFSLDFTVLSFVHNIIRIVG